MNLLWIVIVVFIAPSTANCTDIDNFSCFGRTWKNVSCSFFTNNTSYISQCPVLFRIDELHEISKGIRIFCEPSYTAPSLCTLNLDFEVFGVRGTHVQVFDITICHKQGKNKEKRFSFIPEKISK